MSLNILDEIVRYTFKRVELEKRIFTKLPEREKSVKKLSIEKSGILCEYKRASPTGIINLNLTIEQFIKTLDNYNFVYGFSILTEPFYFLGNYVYLKEACNLTSKPILMKDFIVDTWQIDLAYSIGADIILLIYKVLKDVNKVIKFVEYCKNLNLNAIIEVDNLNDAKLITEIFSGRDIILGINSRDLTTMKINHEKVLKILQEIQFKGSIIVMSGIKSNNDIIPFLKFKNVKLFLIGTSLMKNLEKIKEFEKINFK